MANLKEIGDNSLTDYQTQFDLLLCLKVNETRGSTDGDTTVIKVSPRVVIALTDKRFSKEN